MADSVTLIDHFQNLSKYVLDLIEQNTSLLQDNTNLRQNISDLFARVAALEKAIPPTTDEIKTIMELRDLMKDFPRRCVSIMDGNRETH
jgi:hypothetical protein